MARLPMRLFLAVVLLVAACGGDPAAGAGGAPAGRLDAPDALDFGVVPVGSTATRSLSLRNLGAGDLAIEALELAPPFATTAVLPATVAPGESLAVPVSFTPESECPSAATAVVRAGGRTREVALSGTGGPSPLRCEPGTIDLGRPVAGSTRTFVVSCANRSEGEVAVELRGPEEIAPVTTPLRIPTGGEPVAFELAYRPRGLAPLDAPLHFVAGSVPLAEVQVRATPIATAVWWPDAFACPGGLDVGFAAPGTTTSRTFSLRNRGDDTLRVTGAALEGPFSIAPGPPFAVPPDDPATAEDEGTVEVTVTFAPTTAGPVAGQLHLAFDDPGTPEAGGCLTAFGGGPVPVCDPPALDFGAVASSAPRTATVTCRNDGTDVPGTDADRLHLVAAVSGPGFSLRTFPPAEGLGPGEATTLDVAFGPTATGPTSGILAIATDAPGVPRLDVPLAGDGYLLPPCAYRLEPPALAFGPVATGGTPATLAVSIANEGDEPCLLRDVRLAPGTSPAFSLPEGPVDVRFLAPGETLAVPVRFAPTAGEAAGSLALWIAAPDAPDAVPLSGSTAAAEPCLRIYPESVDFGDVAPGCASLTAAIDLWNTCPTPLTLADVAWLGPDAPFRVDAPAPGTVVASGLGATVQVEYRPTSPGEHLAGLRVTSTAEPGTRLVPIRGRAAAPSGLETFPPEPAKIDVLLVMDNSGGIVEMQRRFSLNLPSLFAPATEWNLDWQFGVTTTGLANPCGNPGGAGGAEDGRLFPVDNSRPRIVRPSTPDALGVAAANVLVGDCHYDEQGLEAAYRGLTPPVIDHADDPRHPEPNDGNRGFLRTGARLAVIVVTDEADQSPETVPFYARTMGGAKRERWREHRFVGHAVTGDPGTGCSRAGTGSCGAGDKLYAWTLASGGGFLSACSIDEESWERFRLEVFGRTHYFLQGQPSGSPSPATSDLRIFVDGVLWQGPSNGWRWDATANAVIFDPAWAPGPTETVEVRYSPRCVPPAG